VVWQVARNLILSLLIPPGSGVFLPSHNHRLDPPTYGDPHLQKEKRKERERTQFREGTKIGSRRKGEGWYTSNHKGPPYRHRDLDRNDSSYPSGPH
jgi:hypothetical protein